MFSVIQAAVAIGYFSDNLIVNFLYGPAAVANFAVPARLFWFISMAVTLMLSPLWPAYGEAVARGDVGWVRGALHRSIAISLSVGVPLALILIMVGRPLIHAWTGHEEMVPSWGLLLAFGIWATTCVLSTAVSMFLNGLNLMRFQAAANVAMAVLNVGLSLLLGHWLGPAGVLYGTAVAQVVAILLPSLLHIPNHLKKLSRMKEPTTESTPPRTTKGSPITGWAEGA